MPNLLLDVPIGTVVKLNGSGLSHHRKLTQHGGQGIAYGGGFLTDDEAHGTFEWLGTDGGRYAKLHSHVSGRQGMLARNFLRQVVKVGRR